MHETRKLNLDILWQQRLLAPGRNVLCSCQLLQLKAMPKIDELKQIVVREPSVPHNLLTCTQYYRQTAISTKDGRPTRLGRQELRHSIKSSISNRIESNRVKSVKFHIGTGCACNIYWVAKKISCLLSQLICLLKTIIFGTYIHCRKFATGGCIRS